MAFTNDMLIEVKRSHAVRLPFSIAFDKYFRNHFSIDLVQTRVRALSALSGLEVRG